MYFEYLLVMAPTGQTARQSPQNSHSRALSPLATTCVLPSFLKNCKASIICTSLQMLMHSPHRMQRFMLKSRTRLRRSSGRPLGLGFTRLVTPCWNAMSCSSQWPSASQTGQSSGWIERCFSTAFFLAANRSSPSARTTIPASAFAVHDRTGAFFPSTMTRHIPQEPKGSKV